MKAQGEAVYAVSSLFDLFGSRKTSNDGYEILLIFNLAFEIF